MRQYEQIQRENMRLLVEIFKIKETLKKLYQEHGPNSSDYISLSIKLDVLVREYIDEKMILIQDHFGPEQESAQN